MQEFDSKKKLTIGLFVLIAIILLSYNGFRLMTLYDTPIIGASLETRLAGEKWNRLKDRLLNEKKINWEEHIDNLTGLGPSVEVKVEDNIPPIKDSGEAKDNVPPIKVSGEQENEKVLLPVITGIIKRPGFDGNPFAAVMINNKLFYQNENIEGFVIKEITENGIYLTKGKRSWFVEAPEASYSVDRGK